MILFNTRQEDKVMMVQYRLSVDGYIDSKGEYSLLNDTLGKFGAGVLPLLTDRYGKEVILEDVSTDFKYTVSYDYNNGEVIRTYIGINGFTLNLQVKAEIASRASYLINQKDDWKVIDGAYFDFVYHLGNSEEAKSELDVTFEFNRFNENSTKEDIEKAVSADISELVQILYKASKGNKDE